MTRVLVDARPGAAVEAQRAGGQLDGVLADRGAEVGVDRRLRAELAKHDAGGGAAPRAGRPRPVVRADRPRIEAKSRSAAAARRDDPGPALPPLPTRPPTARPPPRRRCPRAPARARARCPRRCRPSPSSRVSPRWCRRSAARRSATSPPPRRTTNSLAAQLPPRLSEVSVHGSWSRSQSPWPTRHSARAISRVTCRPTQDACGQPGAQGEQRRDERDQRQPLDRGLAAGPGAPWACPHPGRRRVPVPDAIVPRA